MDNQVYVEKHSECEIYNDGKVKPRLTEEIRPEDVKEYFKNSSHEHMTESLVITTSSVVSKDTIDSHFDDHIKQFQYQISKIEDNPNQKLQKPPPSRNNIKRDSRTIDIEELKNIDLVKAKMHGRKVHQERTNLHGSHANSEESFEASSDDEEIKKSTQQPKVIEPVKAAEQPPNSCKKPSISDYEILGLIGEGAFGKVHHVVRKSDGEQFALKVLAKKNVTKKMQTEIQRERELLMDVDHPSIIKLHQCFHDPKNLYFVMDCAENGELFQYMKNEGILDIKEAQFLIAEMISIVEYLQKKHICHRDIKPGNLLFDSNMHLKLIDFGAGKYYLNKEKDKPEIEVKQPEAENPKEFKRLGTFIGTYEYMAPEVIQGTSSDNSCDLWSIGIILYKFFAEFSPFMGGFAEETLAKIQEEEIEFPEEFPEVAKTKLN